MLKTLLKITFIICANLLAFLTLGHILDALLGTGDTMKLASVLISLPVLGILMYLKIGNILHQLHDISSHDGK